MISEATIYAFKERLRMDAEQVAADTSSSKWLDLSEWPQYTEKHIHARLYEEFSDQELLEILREAANRIGRLPNKKDVFCIYRVFIQRRFGNWPRAQTAAGLRPPVDERRARTRRRHQENERQKADCRAKRQAEQQRKEERERLESTNVPHDESAPG